MAHYGMIVFFLTVGVSFFVPFPYATLIAAVAAVVAGIGLLLGK